MPSVTKNVFMVIFLIISLSFLITNFTVYTTSFTEKLAVHIDVEGKSFHPWQNDTRCQHFITQFAKKGSLPARALVSFPGSGNTWIR